MKFTWIVTRELHTMQLQYDKETHHGIYAAEQERWNRKIDGELKNLIN